MDRCVALFVLFSVLCSVGAQFTVETLKNAFKNVLDLHATNERQARETQESVQTSIQQLVDQINNLPVASETIGEKERRDDEPVFSDLFSMLNMPLQDFNRQSRGTEEAGAKLQEIADKISKATDVISSKRDINSLAGPLGLLTHWFEDAE